MAVEEHGEKLAFVQFTPVPDNFHVQGNNLCATSVAYTQGATYSEGKVTYYMLCGLPTSATFTLNVIAEWWEANFIQNLDTKNTSVRYTNCCWRPQKVGEATHRTNADYSYRTNHTVRVWNANWSFYSDNLQWFANYKGMYYPRVAAVGRPGWVPHPWPPFNPNRAHERDQYTFTENCKAWYRLNEWTYYTGAGWENHHIKPLRWGGAPTDGTNCYRIGSVAHAQFNTYWDVRNWRTPISQ